MTKDEALDLALEALEKLKRAFFKNASTAKEIEQGCDRGYKDYEAEFVEPALKAITAIKQARSVPAAKGWKLVPVNPTPEMLAAADQGDREYTLRNFGDVQTVMQGPEDHYVAMLDAAPEPPAPAQPVDGTQVSKVWWDGEKLMAKPIPLEDFYQPVQEPVSMRMPKVGDKVVCLEDESIGTVVYLTAGGSPEIKFDDGSHGTYMLREFAELFGYTTPPAIQRQWVGLTDEEITELEETTTCLANESWLRNLTHAIEAKLKEKNNG